MKKYKTIFKEASENAFNQVDITVSSMIFEDLVEHIASLNQFGKDLKNGMGSNNEFWNKYLSDKIWNEIDESLLYQLTRKSEVSVELADLDKYGELADNFQHWNSDFQIDEIIMKYDDIHVKFSAEFTGRWNDLENEDFENPIFSDDQKEESIEVKGMFFKTSTDWECELD